MLLLVMFRFGVKNIPRVFESNRTAGPNLTFAIISQQNAICNSNPSAI